MDGRGVYVATVHGGQSGYRILPGAFGAGGGLRGCGIAGDFFDLDILLGADFVVWGRIIACVCKKIWLADGRELGVVERPAGGSAGEALGFEEPVTGSDSVPG